MSSAAESYKEYQQQGDTALEKLDYESALHGYEKALELEPENPEAYKNIGNVYFSKCQLNRAEKFYLQALDKSPNYIPALVNLSTIFQRKGQLLEAENLLLKVVASNSEVSNSDQITTYFGLVNIYTSLEQFDKAQEYTQKLSELNPDDPWLPILEANRLVLQGKHDRAILVLEKLLARSIPATVAINAYLNLGKSYAELEQYEQAISVGQNLLSLNPNDFSAHAQMGWSYLQLEQYEQALRYYTKALELEPMAVSAYIVGQIMSTILYIKRDSVVIPIEEYIASLEKFIRVRPEFPETYISLSFLYHLTGNKTQASLYAQKTLQIDSNRAIYFDNAGISYK